MLPELQCFRIAMFLGSQVPSSPASQDSLVSRSSWGLSREVNDVQSPLPAVQQALKPPHKDSQSLALRSLILANSGLCASNLNSYSVSSHRVNYWHSYLHFAEFEMSFF